MLIGLTGLAGSGKDSVADALESNRGFVRVGFADPMKHFLADILGWDRQVLWGPSELRNWRDPATGRTVREALHSLGTAWGRDMVHPDIWVRYLLRRVGEAGGNVVVSDVRMSNEAAAMRRAGAVMVRIVRPGLTPLNHITEQHADTIDVDRVILNNSTLDVLRAKAVALCS